MESEAVSGVATQRALLALMSACRSAATRTWRGLRAVVLALIAAGATWATPWCTYADAAALPAVTASSAAASTSASAVPPVAKSAASAAPAETPSAAATAAASGASAASSASVGSAASAALPGASAAPAASSAASSAYAPNPQPQFGKYAIFRNLIPSPVLEAQAADEFAEIVRGAAHANRLYPADDARMIRVQTIVDKLIPYSLKWNERAKAWKWEIAVIRSPDIRMYCLPGGKIVIYSGILDRVHLNDNELGMLLGHEIAHALREHARERLGEQQAAQLDSSGTIPQLFGLADLGVAPLGIGSQLLEMKYTNTDETEADVIGSDIASRAGYDPRAAITLWDKLAAATHNNRDQGYIYVHPYTPARRADIMKRLPDMLPLYAKAIGKTVDQLPDYAGIGRPRRTGLRDQLAPVPQQ
jgi:Zn-dependent protease with chaperone function